MKSRWRSQEYIPYVLVSGQIYANEFELIWYFTYVGVYMRDEEFCRVSCLCLNRWFGWQLMCLDFLLFGSAFWLCKQIQAIHIFER